jgi:hypothetical protein
LCWWLPTVTLCLQLYDPSVGLLQLVVSLFELSSNTLQVGAECYSDLGEDLEVRVFEARQRYLYLLSATGVTRNVAVVTDAQLLVMPRMERK